jgi:hypothetical protein
MFFESNLPGVYAFFSRKPITPGETNSFFWRSVVEYKYKIKQLKAKIAKAKDGKDIAKLVEKIKKISPQYPIQK